MSGWAYGAVLIGALLIMGILRRGAMRKMPACRAIILAVSLGVILGFWRGALSGALIATGAWCGAGEVIWTMREHRRGKR